MDSASSIPTVFLDRDGTINVDFGYVINPADIELIPGAAEAIASIREFGYKVAIISNQSAIGRGMASADDIDKCNQALTSLLLKENPLAIVDLVLYSSDHPEQATSRRKPGIGLLDDLSWQYDPQKSWMVGDKSSDVEFGKNAGLASERCLLIGDGPAAVRSLSEAAESIIAFASK